MPLKRAECFPFRDFYLSDRYWPEIGNPKVWRTYGRTDQLTRVGSRDTCVSKNAFFCDENIRYTIPKSKCNKYNIPMPNKTPSTPISMPGRRSHSSLSSPNACWSSWNIKMWICVPKHWYLVNTVYTVLAQHNFCHKFTQLFGVPFTGLKNMCRTKNDKYQVCIESKNTNVYQTDNDMIIKESA